MEVSIFTRPEVSRVLSRFVEMRLHVDGEDEELAETFKKYQLRLVNSSALPSYAIIEPDEPEKLRGKYHGADLPYGTRFTEFLANYLARRR
jgi:hypothetical protein